MDLNDLRKSLEITVPAGVKLSEVQVNVSSTDITCKGIEAGSVDIHASSGNISADCMAKNIRLDASSGNLMLLQKGDSDEITLHASSGNVKADVEKTVKMNISISSGNATVSADAVKDFNSRTSSGKGEYHFAQTPRFRIFIPAQAT